MDDVSTRHCQLGLYVERRQHFNAGTTRTIGCQGVLHRLGKDSLQCMKRSVLHPFTSTGGVVHEEVYRRVQPEQPEYVIAGFTKLRAQNRGIGERMAVDLAWQRIWDSPCYRLTICLLKSPIALSEMQCPSKADGGINARPKAWQSANHQIDFRLASVGCYRLVAQQLLQNSGCTVGEYERCSISAAVGQGYGATAQRVRFNP